MLRLLSILSYFLKELIFDSKDEYDLMSSKFNMRKVAVFVVSIACVSLNVFLVHRTMTLASEIVELKKNAQVDSAEVKPPSQGKNPKLVPSDSGIASEKPPGKAF